MSKFLKFFKRPLGISLIVVLIIAILGYFYFLKKNGNSLEIVSVSRGTIVQEVSVTGKTKPAQDVDLAFEQSGKVRKINVDVGDNVTAGQILVEQDTSELYAELAETEATIESRKATLVNLQKGAQAEEIQVYETKVLNAKTALDDAKRNLIDKIQDGYTKSDDAVRNKIDQYFTNSRSANPSLLFDSSYKAALESERVNTEYVLTSWKNSVDNLIISSNLDSSINSAKLNLNSIKSFLEKNSLALNALTSNSSLSQTTIDTYRSSVSTARTNVNTAITNLQAAEEKWRTAESTLSLAEKDLDLKKAGSTAEEIAAQAALVKESEARVQTTRVKINKRILYAPISGIVTKQDAKIGEVVSANSVVVSIISANKFEIEVNIPEADIAKIKINDTADITLDAFGNDVVLRASVTSIDPGEVIIEGVATYKVVLHFLEEKEGIKPGMTANIDIFTARKDNVLVIPQRLVSIKDSEKFVRILDEKGAAQEVKVKTGLRGSDGNIEITEGLIEGDKVVIDKI